MRYALLSRFQGTLVAAALGDELGADRRSQQARSLNETSASGQTRSLASWHPGLELDVVAREPFGGKAAIRCARALAEAGGWSERVRAAIALPVANGSATPDAVGTIAAELAIATLPIALFWHEDEARQQQRLLQTVRLWHCPPGTEVGMLAVGYAIAQALQERLEPRTLLPQTIAYLKQSTANPTAPLLELIGALEQAQTLVRQRAGLYAAIERLQTKGDWTGKGAIALAFYCFLSTPDDLQLALLRAARCGEAASAIGALTGALSGAHHSLSGLPLTWQGAHDSRLHWGMAQTALRELAARLFTVWSGVYDPTRGVADAAIAAPGMIRPR